MEKTALLTADLAVGAKPGAMASRRLDRSKPAEADGLVHDALSTAGISIDNPGDV